jgi:hypothetical protein
MKTSAIHSERQRRCKALVFCVLTAVLPVGGCHDDGPTAARGVTPLPFATPTPNAGPLAAVQVTLAPATSAEGYWHAFTVHIEVRETRGVPITAIYQGVSSSAGGYLFPERESSATWSLPLVAFGSGTFDVLVEHNDNIPCDAGLIVTLKIQSADGLMAFIDKRFDCTTGYWPLG